jgi:hypothetical protein
MLYRGRGILRGALCRGTETRTDSPILHELRGPFTVTIVAVDLAGNASAPSNANTVSTQGGGCF